MKTTDAADGWSKARQAVGRMGGIDLSPVGESSRIVAPGASGAPGAPERAAPPASPTDARAERKEWLKLCADARAYLHGVMRGAMLCPECGGEHGGQFHARERVRCAEILARFGMGDQLSVVDSDETARTLFRILLEEGAGADLVERVTERLALDLGLKGA